MQELNTHQSPAASTITPYYIFGAVSFFAFSLLTMFSSDALLGHYFHPKLLAITHIAALGWGSMIIFGALFQLLPVILETKIYNEALVKVIFWVFAVGIILLATSFWNFNVGFQLQFSSCIVFLACTLFTFVIIKTASKKTKWNIETDFICTSTIWLMLTAILGTLMAFNFQHPFLNKSHLVFLKIHAHFGIIGWFLCLIMGVSSKLLPMFLLSSASNSQRLKLAYYFVNIGLILFAITAYYFEGKKLLLIPIALLLFGIACFLSFMHHAFKTRMRKNLDFGLKHSALALIILILPLLLSVLITLRGGKDEKMNLHLSVVYGVSIFLGFISSLILGQTFKTLPFIVWIDKYRKNSGTEKTPLPKDLYSNKIIFAQYFTYLAAIVTIIPAIIFEHVLLTQVGALLLLLTALFYNINVFKILFITTKI